MSLVKINFDRATSEGTETMAEYRIENVSDFLNVPIARRDACLQGFADWLEIADDLAAIKMPGNPYRYDFIDDGKRDRAVIIHPSDFDNRDNGDKS